MFVPALREVLLRARARLAPHYEVETVNKRCKLGNNRLQYFLFFASLSTIFSLGDWLLIYQLGKNIDPLIFKEFIHSLYKKIEDESGSALIS